MRDLLNQEYRAVIGNDLNAQLRNIQPGNATLKFPTFEDINREVIQEVNMFLDNKVHQIVLDLLEMSYEGLQNAHSIYNIKTQIGELTFLLNKNVDTLSTQTILSVSFEQTKTFMRLQRLTPEGVVRTVPPNLFNIETVMANPPPDRIILQPYREETWGRSGMYASLSLLAEEQPAKFSSTTIVDLNRYVTEELVQDFKDRAENLITGHIFRPEIQTHEAVIDADPYM